MLQRHIVLSLLSLVWLLTAQAVHAEPGSIWHAVSPAPGASVNNGQILLVVEYDSTISLKENSVEIFLDDYLLSNHIKIFKNQISMLYLLPLKPGAHRFEVRANANHIGWLRPLIWDFMVRPANGPDEPAAVNAAKDSKSHWAALTGNVGFEYRRYAITGDAKSLRQELPVTRNLYVNTNLRLGKVNIPLKYYNTSDEQNYVPALQSRNYFQVGVQTKWLDARYGDLNPNLDRLVLPGIRLHGELVSFKLKRAQLTVVDGYMQRPLDGTLNQYVPGSGVPPSNLQSDYTYINPGTYRRRVSAMRLTLGNQEEGAATSINIMKAKDDIFSIKYGGAPQDNLVLGIDQSVVTNESKMRINAGLAVSFYTRDITGGSLSKASIDSVFGFSMPVDPMKWQNVMVINGTSNKYSKQSLAGYFNTVFHSRYNDLTLEYRYVGGAYVSLANPFLLSDLRGGIVQDQMYLWKRRVIFTTRYNIQLSNLSESQFNFVNTHIGNANILIAPNPKLPRFNLYYIFQWRISPPTESLLASANDQLNAVGGNIAYSFNAWGMNHSIMLNGYQSNRLDRIWTGNDMGIRNVNLSLYEQLPLVNMSVDASVSKALISDHSAAGYQSLYTLFSGRAKYKIDKLKSEFGLGYGINVYSASRLSEAAQRNMYRFTYTGHFVKDLLVDLDAGFAPYESFSLPLAYQENYVILRVSYGLNFR